MATTDTNEIETRLPLAMVVVVVALSLLPALLMGARVLGWIGGTASSPVAQTAAISRSLLFVAPQVAGFIVGCLVTALCFVHFSRTGIITPPLIGIGVLCAGAMDLAQLIIAWYSPEDPYFLPFSWTLIRAFFVLAIIMACAAMLLSGQVKGQLRRRKQLLTIAFISVIFAAINAGILYLCANRPDLTATLYGGKGARLGWNLVPLVLILVAAGYVLPTFYAWQKDIFVRSLMLSCLPLALAQGFFALGWDGADPLAFYSANLLKLGAYVCPLLGLILDYERTLSSMEKGNRRLRNELFVLEQSKEVAKQKQRLVDGLLGALACPVCVLDSSMRVTVMNQEQLQLCGATHAMEVLGKQPEHVFGEAAAPHIREQVRRVLDSGAAAVVPPTAFNAAGGASKRIAWNISPLRNEQKQTMGVVCVGTVA